MPNTATETFVKRRTGRRLDLIQLKTTLEKLPEVRVELVNALVKVVYGIVEADRSSTGIQMGRIVNQYEDDLLLLLDPGVVGPKPAAIGKGRGLGERLAPAEGVRRLREYAQARPIEEWAGIVASAGELEEHYGIPRSTLNQWRKTNSVIAFRRDKRNYSYPIEQFIDGRPIEGLAAIVDIAPDKKAAWLWLKQSHGALDGQSPIEALRNGLIKRVAIAAKRDFC